MRWLPVLAVVVAACGDAGWPHGTYLFVDGHEAQIAFDSVEVLFAKPHGDRIPIHTPSGYQPDLDEDQLLLKRVAPMVAGVQAVPMGEQVDLYIPPDVGEEHGVGEYVVVIASRAGTPVGIGEYHRFAEQVADITRYQVVLQPYVADEIERWGRDAGGATHADCLRWTRSSGSSRRSIAIVRDHDNDCDAFPDARIDCDAYAYCDGGAGAGCIGEHAPCTDSTVCTLGRCVNEGGSEAKERVCQPTVCLMDAACARCDERLSPDEYLGCAAHLENHIEVRLTLWDDDSLCFQPFEFGVPLSSGYCGNPVIEWVRADDLEPSPFTFEVETHPDGLGKCLFTLRGPPEAAFEPHHLLVSVDVTNIVNMALRRTMFTIGVETGRSSATCVEPYYELAGAATAVVGSCLDYR